MWAVVLTKEALAALSPPSRGPVLLLGFDNSSSAPLGAGYYLLWGCSVVPPVYPRNCLWCSLSSPGLSQVGLPTFQAPTCLCLEGPSPYEKSSYAVQETQLKSDLLGEAIPGSIPTYEIITPLLSSFCDFLHDSVIMPPYITSLSFQNTGPPYSLPTSVH